MAEPAIGQGRILAELFNHYHQYRSAYLSWSAGRQPNTNEAILNYQRALLAWYEARIRQEQPYTGEIYHFIQVASTHYAGQEVAAEGNWQAADLGGIAQDPLMYLPHPISLTDSQKLMSRQFQELGQSCKELLLLAYYHRLSDARLREVLEVDGRVPRVAINRSKCLLLIRQGWQTMGLAAANDAVTPEQYDVIDRYFRHELNVSDRWEVESLRSSNRQFQEAMSLREDWQDCLLIAGRQDTLTTIQREEEEYRPAKPVTAPITSKKITLPKVNIPTVKLPKVKLPKSLQSYAIIALAGLLGWLLYTTFVGGKQEERLFQTYFKPYPSLTITNEGTSADRELKKMLSFYERGDYLTAYDELLPAASAYPSAPLYLGVSALALNQPQRALDWFDQYTLTDAYRPYSDWYSALAYLSLGRRPAALSLLSEMAGTAGHPYERAAAQLIEELE